MVETFVPFDVLLFFRGDHQRSLSEAAIVVGVIVCKIFRLVFAFNVAQIVALVFLKEWMTKALPVFGITCFTKVIHIELAYKAAEVVMFKVFGEYIGSKFISILYTEAIAHLVPNHSVTVRRILHSELKLTFTIS